MNTATAYKQTMYFSIAIFRTFCSHEAPPHLFPPLLARVWPFIRWLPHDASMTNTIIHYWLLKVISNADAIIFVKNARIGWSALDPTPLNVFRTPVPLDLHPNN